MAAVAAAAALPGLSRAAGSCQVCHSAHFATLGECVTCHRGDPRSRRPDIAHHELIAGRYSHFAVPGSPITERGQKLIDQAACRRCHVTGGKGNRLATDLDRLLPGGRPAEAQVSIQKPALFMPDFGLPDDAAVAIVNALLASSARAPRRAGETPQVVHFATGPKLESAFETHCGGCHRVLTRSQGGLGKGAIGPNLSGLFTEHYPASFGDGQRWTAANLKKWVENPRQVRKQAVMAPVRLTDEQWRQVLAVFEVE